MQRALPFPGFGAPPPRAAFRLPPRKREAAPGARPDLAAPAMSADDIARGTARLFQDMGFETLAELRLASGRRVDVIGLDGRGRFVVAEVKSGVADWRADDKWPEYLPFCDWLYVAVGPAFPLDRLPAEVGVVVADRYGGEVARPAPKGRMAAAERRRQTVLFARAASGRLRRLDAMQEGVGA